MNLPEPFEKKMTHLLKDEANPFFDTYKQTKASGIRVNPLKLSLSEWEELSPFDMKRIPFVETGYYYDPEHNQPGKHPYHAAGLYYVQEPSAMFVADVLKPESTDTVLDLCAAPGGKTTQLAGYMENEGILVANEINPKRAKALSENVERMGIKNTIVLNEAPEKLALRFEGFFNKILVDAPCSGEGMFRKDEDAITFWSEAHVDHCAKQQRHILKSAYSMLKEGGILVYSTCTFSPEENEQTIEDFLNNFPDMELLPIEKKPGIVDGNPTWTKTGNVELTKTKRLWPHHLFGEGHFVAKLIKHGSNPSSKQNSVGKGPSKNELQDFYNFANNALMHVPVGPYFSFKQQLFSLPENCFDFSGLKVVRAGLHLGEFKKNRFEPNHSLALSLKRSEVKHTHSISLETDDWKRFLKGETLQSTGDSGWVLILLNGYPLGWGKETEGIIKNYYPKGLRLLL